MAARATASETWSSRSCTASAAAGGGASRTCSSPRLGSNLEDRQRLERRRAEHVAGSKIELRRVARADDDVALELAVRERALLVRARVLEGDPALGGPAEADGAPSTSTRRRRRPSRRQPLCRADGMPGELAHRPLATRAGSCRPPPRSRASRRAEPRRGARPRARPRSSTFSRRDEHDDREPDRRATTSKPDRPGRRDPVEVRAVVRLGVERAVEAEDRRRPRPPRRSTYCHGLFPLDADEPERDDGEHEVDELDRERADRGGEDERRELVVREERRRTSRPGP